MSSRWDRRSLALVQVAVLSSSILLMLPGAWGNSVTVVEFAQLPAGLAAWQRHSLGIYRVCGPVSKFLYALPAYVAGIRVDYPLSHDSDVQSRQEWDLGQIFQKQNSWRYHNIYRWSRLLPMLVTLLGGCLICEWSTRLFGRWPGIVSLCVWCWMPPILAHGSLVTSDIVSAVMMVLAARCFWSMLLAPSPLTAILAGAALGLAAATKFTLLILYPCWTLLLLGRALQLRGEAAAERPRKFPPARLVACGVGLLITSIVVVDALYLFQDVGFHLAQWQPGLSSLAKDLHGLGEHRATAWILQVPLPIPLEFLRGLDFQLADTERLQDAYLLGQTQFGGWMYWYLVATLFKVPLPALMLAAVALIRLPGLVRHRSTVIWGSLCILLPAFEAGVTISATTGTGTNAAFRYLVPSLALTCVLSGLGWDNASTGLRIRTIGLLGWTAINAIAGVPDHLGWRNELGSLFSRQRPALIGDSLDWGQDLARLGGWIERHSSEGSTLVCVYGPGESEPYGLMPPNALPVSRRVPGYEFLAVSEDILFGYEVDRTVGIGGKRSWIDDEQRAALQQRRSSDRIGRTILIYRAADVRDIMD
jgi:hypothetical protein